MAEEYSITMKNLSLCGSMKKINLESYLCSKEQTLVQYSLDSQKLVPTLKP
jgi:hypothetical protein